MWPARWLVQHTNNSGTPTPLSWFRCILGCRGSVQHGNEKLADAAAYQAWGCEQRACGVLQRGKCGGALEDLSFDLAHCSAHPKSEAPMTCKYKQLVKLNHRTAEDMNC